MKSVIVLSLLNRSLAAREGCHTNLIKFLAALVTRHRMGKPNADQYFSVLFRVVLLLSSIEPDEGNFPLDNSHSSLELVCHL